MRHNALRLSRLALAVLFVVTLLPRHTALAQTSGPTQRALRLDGTDDYVAIPNAAALNPSGAITIEAWVNRSSSSRCETVVGKNYSQSFWLGFCNQTIRFYAHGTGSAVDGVTPIPAARWTHIAVTYDGTTRRYYVDGALDLVSTANAGPLTASAASLMIGRDTGPLSQYSFAGLIDEVRLWNVVRTQAEIRAGMASEIGVQPGLVGLWRLNGDGRDALGLYEGTLYGGALPTIAGVLPAELTIPASAAAVTVDGSCGAAEYGGSERVAPRFYNGGKVIYLQHSADQLYICMEGLSQENPSSAAVAVDRDLSRDDPARPGDYRFLININGASIAAQGNGAGGFSTLAAPAGSWQAARTVALEFTWTAEFRISRSLLGLPADWSTSVGLDLEELGVPGGPSHWPATAAETLPSTWSPARFSSSTGAPPTYTISGYVRTEVGGTGIAGSLLRLYASNSSGTSLIGTHTTSPSGFFSFSYTGYSPGAFLLEQSDARGYYSVSATASGGSVVSPNALRFPGSATGRTYTGMFYDQPGLSPGQRLDRHYLIVHAPAVTPWSLQPLITMKQIEGFRVETVSTTTISATIAGRDLEEQVRGWLRARWLSYRPAPIYALLVGDASTIPVREVGFAGPRTYRRMGQPGYFPALLTEWYYADLDSDWDTNDDGYYGDYIYCAPGESEVPTADPDVAEACPPEGSPLREGPYGTLPGPADDWKAEIALGRLPLNEAARVRKALETSAATEAASPHLKRSGVLAGAFWSFNGRSWNAERGAYDDGSGPWISGGWPAGGTRPFGDDSAVALETLLRPAIDPALETITTLYNTTSPGDDASLIPTAQDPDLALTRANMEAAWSDGPRGLVNVVGHGDGGGVYSANWVRDWNDNGRIENPAAPDSCAGGTCWEIGGTFAYIHDDMPAPVSIAPVVFANACSTGDAWTMEPILDDGGVPTGANNWIRGGETIVSTLAGDGKLAAWVGAVSIVPVHGLDGLQRDFNRDIVQGQLLGDAMWEGMEGLIGNGSDWRNATEQLFGDPALSYWGNPADTRAFWPQSGRDWGASSASSASGPETGIVLWTKTDYTPSSPPVVDRFGNIIVGGSERVVKFRPNGTVGQLSAPGAMVLRAPAITTDGLYSVSGTTLQAYASSLGTPRFSVGLPDSISGSPRVGPDGVVWVATNAGMVRLTGAGQPQLLPGGAATGPAALTLDGALWTTTGGALRSHRVDRRGGVTTAGLLLSGTITPPAIAPNGKVYVGSTNGHLYSATIAPLASTWSYDTGASITARPAAGPGGTVFVGNGAGRIVALSPAGGLLWSRTLDAAIVTTPAVDGSRLYVVSGTRLYALSVATGEMLWSVGLGASTTHNSSPVIGANRTLYVTTSGGRLVAIGEPAWVMAPSGLAVSVGLETATISWEDNSIGEGGFLVERCDEGGCVPVGTAAANATSLSAGLVPAGRPFSYRVQALPPDAGSSSSFVAPAGAEGVAAPAAPAVEATQPSDFIYSDFVSARAPLPAAPSSVVASAASTDAATVRWTYQASTAQLQGFKVERAVSAAGPFVEVGAAGPAQRSYLDEGLEPGKIYYYRARAYNESGPSAATGPASATTRSLGLPAPEALAARSQRGVVALSWRDHAGGERAYLVERRAPGEGDYQLLALLPPDSQSFEDALMLAQGGYEYRVKAIADAIESDYAYAVVARFAPRHTFLPLVRSEE